MWRALSTPPSRWHLSRLFEPRIRQYDAAPLHPCSYSSAVFLGKDPLPTPLFQGVGILAVHGIEQLDTAPTFGQILFVNRLDLLEVVLERCLERIGKHGDPIFRASAVTDENLVAGEID